MRFPTTLIALFLGAASVTGCHLTSKPVDEQHVDDERPIMDEQLLADCPEFENWTTRGTRCYDKAQELVTAMATLDKTLDDDMTVEEAVQISMLMARGPGSCIDENDLPMEVDAGQTLVATLDGPCITYDSPVGLLAALDIDGHGAFVWAWDQADGPGAITLTGTVPEIRSSYAQIPMYFVESMGVYGPDAPTTNDTRMILPPVGVMVNTLPIIEDTDVPNGWEDLEGWPNDVLGANDTGSPPCVEVTWYNDADDDGFVELASATLACEAPGATWQTDMTQDDCNDDPMDNGNLAYPDNTEDSETECGDGIDQDCVDGDTVCVVVDTDAGGDTGLDTDSCEEVTWYRDHDDDGFVELLTAWDGCEAPAIDWTDQVTADDCDDSRSDVFPGAAEACDGADNDCNSVVDDSCFTWDADTRGQTGDCESGLYGGQRADGGADHVDDDGDGYCEVAPCVDPAQPWIVLEFKLGGDCDDTVTGSGNNPGVNDWENDLYDNNCDGSPTGNAIPTGPPAQPGRCETWTSATP